MLAQKNWQFNFILHKYKTNQTGGGGGKPAFYKAYYEG